MGRKKKLNDEKLLNLARDMFVRKGLAVSTKRIAESAGVSEAVIYQRYKTKADLFFAAMALPEADVEELFSNKADRGAFLDHLEEISIGILNYFRSLMPILMRLVNHPDFDRQHLAGHHTGEPVQRLKQGFIRFLKTEAEAGRIGPVKVEAAAGLLIDALHTAALHEQMIGSDEQSTEQKTKEAIGVLWSGLEPR